MTRTQTPAANEPIWHTLWRGSPLLTTTGLLMLIVLPLALAGLVLDSRTITGAPAWLKPMKFAASIAIYVLTLAWIFSYLEAWPRTRRIVGGVTAATLLIEILLISIQAWRGTASHFNIETPFDQAVFASMGIAIMIQTISSVAVAVALWRQRFSDAALGWALRLGMVMTIAGASTGGLMVQPTTAQLDEARLTHRMVAAGAHTVGGPDGGPGLPLTGWSLEHGDIRVAHFVGLHALQVLPLLLLGIRRRSLPETARVRLVVTAAASYTALFVILLWQGLRGQGVVHPDQVTLGLLAVWAAVTATTAWAVVSRRRLSSAPSLC